MDGAAAVGVGTTFARNDHVHPTDTSRAPLASPTFTGTATAPTFAGNLTGFKNVDNTNEMTLANGFTGGQLYMNYRGASSAITQVMVGNGMPASGVLAKIIALNIDASGNTTGAAASAPLASTLNNYVTLLVSSRALCKVLTAGLTTAR
jgi:hypothetical protein